MVVDIGWNIILILFIEPISKNIGMYVPAYPLPIMEIASFVKFNRSESEIRIISLPVDYGLPLTHAGKEQIYKVHEAERGGHFLYGHFTGRRSDSII